MPTSDQPTGTPGVEYFLELEALPMVQVTPDFSRRTVTGEKQMVVWGKINKGGIASAHSHAEEQMFWILSGRLRSRIGDRVQETGPGAFITVPSWAEHESEALEDTTFVTFLSGIRKDLTGNNAPAHFKDE